MRTRFFILALALSAAGCSSNSTPIPNIPSATVKSLSISGPATIAPGATAAFTATAQLSNGLAEDYTTKVTWRTTNLSVLTIDAQGRATGRTGGETQVVASVSSATSRANVMVIPPETFRLTGTVTESGVPVSQATVAVSSGTGSGLVTLTDFNGQYRLYGVAGAIEITVTKSGYATAVQPMVVTAASVADVAVAQTNPLSLAGTYLLTISADTGCRGPFPPATALPAELVQRHYTATVTQTGPAFHVELSGAEFLVSNGAGNNFSGTAQPGQISFFLGDGYYTPYPDLFEDVGNGQALLVEGSGTLTQSGADLTGLMRGGVWVGPPPVWSQHFPTSMCSSDTIAFTFTRQTGAAHIRR
jgi:hypothetical protein